jgi:hypothetical protein
VPFVLIQVVMIALVISFPQMVMVYKAKERTFDINKIQIIVPEDQPAGGQPAESNPNAEQDDATKALEKELGGGAKAPDAKDEAAPAGQPPADNPNAEQDDATKALEKALGGTKAPDEKK